MLKTGFVDMLAAFHAQDHDKSDPLISPLFADLTGFPPLLIHAGSHEILLDDSLSIARNAALADVPVELRVWPGYPHDFQMFQKLLEGGRRALEDAAGFMKETMDKTRLRPEN